MPSDTLIVTVLGLFGTFIIGPLIAYVITRENTKREYYDKTLQDRFSLLYCPLKKAIMNTHITSSAIRYPFSYRFYKALSYFQKMNLQQGFRRLSNRFYDRATYEVEYGARFPSEEIERIVKENIRLADAKLVRLVERADRASYERWDEENEGLLAEEKWFLAHHIFEMHKKLSKRLLPKE